MSYPENDRYLEAMVDAMLELEPEDTAEAWYHNEQTVEMYRERFNLFHEYLKTVHGG